MNVITKTIYSLWWIRSFIQSHLVDAAELIFLPFFFPNEMKAKQRRKEKEDVEVKEKSACFNFREGLRRITFIFGLYEVSSSPLYVALVYSHCIGSISSIFNRRKIAWISSGFDDFWWRNLAFARDCRVMKISDSFDT